MNTRNDDPHSELERRSRELFDDSVANLDARTRSRLNQARQTALATVRSRKHAMMRWMVPTGSVAALALIAMISLHSTREPSSMVQTSNGMEDMEIVASADEMELLQNDVEFYDWIDSPEAAASNGEST